MKFAYLIMAHNNPDQLDNLLHLLDFEENEIYLHIDKKSTILNIEEYKDCLKKASIHVYKKYKVYHADITQTKCQTFLLAEACKKYHDYYHLISNADLPLKSHDEIVAFFERNKGKQFVHFESDDFCSKETCKYYRYLFPLICRTRGKTKNILTSLENVLIAMQRKKGIYRKFYCGANWYSITHELAVDFTNNYKKVLRAVRYTISSDELVLQTFLRTMSTKSYDFFKHTETPYDYIPIVRAIDWHRGNPYVWREGDYSYLVSSDFIFGRKFDSQVDEEVIKDISEYVERK